MAELQPVARTAFYCCALRAADAQRAQPVCGDLFAARFLDPEILQEIKPLLKFWRPGASNVARHRLIDDATREAIRHDSTVRIFLLGAGFDTRAYRLTGGRWWEFDDPALIVFKEARLPSATAPNHLTRIPVSFQSDTLARHLAPFAGSDDALVILEGVSMYLPNAKIQEVASTVRSLLPRATFVCDLMSPAFRRRFSRGLSRELARLGAAFADRPDHPRVAVEAAGYKVTNRESIIGRAQEAGTIPVPRWLLNTLFKELRDGYSVYTFRAAQ